MIGLINAQSIKRKDLQLKDVLCEGNIDACFITETWLRDNEEDTAWTQTAVLNNDDYKLHISNRKTTCPQHTALAHTLSLIANSCITHTETQSAQAEAVVGNLK